MRTNQHENHRLVSHIDQISTVYIGIVTYNSITDIENCITAIEQQTYVHISIGIFDNDSTDGTQQWIKQNSNRFRYVISPHNLGFSTAHNHLIQMFAPEAQDFYMCLNPDAVLDQNYINNLVIAAGQYQADWVTGKLLLSGNPDRVYSVGHGLRRDGFSFNIGYGLPDIYNEDREVFGAAGAAALYRPTMFPDMQLFDENIFLYYEDTDVDWRARRQNLRCWYCANAIGWHRGGTLNEALRIQSLGNRFYSIIKNAYLFELLTVNLPIIILHILARLILTPRAGWQLLWITLRKMPVALKKRYTPVISRSEMNTWFQWSLQQSSGRPLSIRQRLTTMLGNRH